MSGDNRTTGAAHTEKRIFTMKATKLLLAVALFGAISLAPAAETRSPDQTTKGKSAEKTPAAPDAAWLAKVKAAYPLKTCVVSAEELGGMGEAVDYVHKEAGKPDRLVCFCCDMCVPKFKKDPAKYLKMIDDAASAAKAKKN